MNGKTDGKLNKEQLAAIKHKKGPLLIIAGAGTGKTTVITERIKYLIEENLAKPSEILALTFTDKAAREMEERVDKIMPYGYTQMWISTFHSFCDRILRAEAFHIGLNPRFKLMTEVSVTQLIRKNIFKFKLKYFRPLGNPDRFIGGMLQHFSRLQDEDVDPQQYLRWIESKVKSQKSKLSSDEKIEIEKWQELAGAYKTYEEFKVKEGLMDFGDLIVKTLCLFRKRPNILRQYKEQFKYILVDEFQDTNFAQNELAILLAGRKKEANITVTGDDDQSIYRFRGAAVSNIIQFKKTYPKAKIIVLTKNYRSNQEILDKAYQLIQHNNPDRLEAVENISKKLVSIKDKNKKLKSVINDKKKVIRKSEKVRFLHLDRVENEAEQVSEEIRKIINEEKVDYKDIAILVRANNHAEPFMRALQRHAIPYQFLGPGRLLRQPEIIDLISYLRVLYNFEDSVSLYRLLSIDSFDINTRDLVKISNYAKRFNLSLFEALEKIEDIYVAQDTKEKIKKILKIINKHFKLIRKETAGQLLYYFLQDANLMQKLLNPDSPDAEKRAKNISKFFDKLKTYEVDHEDATVAAVVDWLELSIELGESPLAADTDWTSVNAVNILTVHSSKGLEFPVVFLANLVGNRFPTIERREQIPIPDVLIKEILPKGDFHLQEERRLFYVGMTRAMNRLYFTAADYYGEGKREKKLSPFIFEALGDEAVGSEKLEVGSEQMSFLDYEKPEISQLSTTSHQLPIHIDFLSYSQIQTFQICPLHYKLRYILKIPTPPSAAASFGSTIHEVMKDFYLAIKAGNKPTIRLLYNLLKKDWVAEGYSSKSHEGKMFERGKEYLKKYLAKEFNPKKLPITLEQPFVVPLRSLARRTVIPSRPLKIGGKIDRVDMWEPASAKAGVGQGIEIIDYKTGEKVPTQKQVDDDLQLTFYALAANSIKEPPFNKPACAGRKPVDLKLSLYFFEEQVKISTIRTQKQLDEAVKEIFAWREKIESSDFACSNNYFCQNNCEYSLLCRV